MIVLDGMPGAGKTTLLHQLRTALPHHLLVFPEAQPPENSCSDTETARFLLEEARDRIDTARHLARTRPGLIVASDRCHIGVLAYRYASASIGRAPHGDFEQALAVCHDLDLVGPQPDLTTLVLLTDPGTSISRRSAYAHNERYALWFDLGFLTAYRHFLDNLPVWLPAGTFTTLDVTDTSGWPTLLDALPPHLVRRLPPREALTGGRSPAAAHEAAAATTRRLLTALAAPPDDTATSQAVDGLRATADEIRAFLAKADNHDTEAVPAAVLHEWRNALARSHRALEQTAPDEWSRWRLPGTWLDSHLRLRSLIAHEVGKAYWDDRPEIRYAEIDIERYLWGAR